MSVSIFTFIPYGAEWEDIEYYTSYLQLEQRMLQYAKKNGICCFGVLYSGEGKLEMQNTYEVTSDFQIAIRLP